MTAWILLSWARRRAGAALLAVALAAPAASAGCAASASQIEQGQAVSTGKEPYDAFFQAVRSVREEAKKAEADAADARAGLARSLGLDEKAAPGEALDAARTRATKLRDAGVLLHLEITPEAKLVTVTGKASLDAGDKGVLAALEESAKSSLALSKRLAELAKRVAELQAKRAALAEESKTAFTGDSAVRPSVVRREIEGAERVLAEAADLGERHAGLASKFVVDLAQAVETGAAAAQRDAPRGPAKAPPRSRKPPPKGAPPRATPPPAQPQPPKKPPAGDDFDP